MITEKERDIALRGHHERQIWTRFCTVLLGIWLLTSPETFGYIHDTLRWSDWISGALLVVFGFVSMSYKLRGWIWGACLVGIWLQLAPLVFWAQEPAAYVNDTLIGVLAIASCILVPLRPESLDLGPEIPPGWTYNPSSWQQRIPVICFAIVGWFIARYLASYQLHYTTSVWDPFFGNGTQEVLTSSLSQKFPISDAGLGATAYCLEALMGAKGGRRRWHTMPWIVFGFGILVVPLGLVSILLVMSQPIFVGAWCGLCLIIAASMLVMLALTVDELVAVLQFLRRSMREGKAFWPLFWKGSSYSEAGIDTRTPGFHRSAWTIIKSMFWGVRVCWNLLLTALLGICLLFINPLLGYEGFLRQSAEVCGALIVVFSIISWAEVIRSARFLNLIIAVWIALVPWVIHSPKQTYWHSAIFAILLFALTLPRGKIKERYGTWDKMIK